MNRHFTATAVILYKEHVLLVYHPRLKSWVPPGGHLESDELPEDAVVRETLEETGVPVDVVSPAVPDTGNNEVFIMKQPLCLHQVKAQEKGETVYHIDIVYLCRLRTDTGELPPVIPGDGISKAQWVKLDQLDSFELAPNVIEVLEIARQFKLLCKNAAVRA